MLGLFGSEPMTREDLVQAAGGGLSDRTLRRRLDGLVGHGLVQRLGEGTKGDPYRWQLTGAGTFLATPKRVATLLPETGSTEPKDSWHAAGGPTPRHGATNPVETLPCPLHGGLHNVTRRVAGLIYLGCGCQLAEEPEG